MHFLEGPTGKARDDGNRNCTRDLQASEAGLLILDRHREWLADVILFSWEF